MSEQQMSGPWAIMFKGDAGCKIGEERFETAEDAFRWLEEQGVDEMQVVVDYASDLVRSEAAAEEEQAIY